MAAETITLREATKDEYGNLAVLPGQQWRDPKKDRVLIVERLSTRYAPKRAQNVATAICTVGLTGRTAELVVATIKFGCHLIRDELGRRVVDE